MLWSDTPIETWPPSQVPRNFFPGQMEIKFFWPLTEQIDLDLDYTDCTRPITSKVIPVGVATGNTVIMMDGNTPTWTTTAVQIKGDTIETPQMTLLLDKKPSFVVKWLYKLLNINWKEK